MTLRRILNNDLKFIEFVDGAIRDYKEVEGLSGREAFLADKEAMAALKEPVEEDHEAELEAEYDGSQQQAQDDYDRTEMQAIKNNM